MSRKPAYFSATNCHSRTGIDGHCFRHFGLNKTQMLAAIRARPDNAALAEWFLYPKSIKHPVGGLFATIAQDEGLPKFPAEKISPVDLKR